MTGRRRAPRGAAGASACKARAWSAPLGLALFWAWTSLNYYNLILFPGVQDASGVVRMSWTATSWAQALAFMGIAALARKAGSLLARGWALPCAALAASLGTAMFPGSPLLPAGDAGALAGAALTGASGAAMASLWAELLCPAGARRSARAMAVSLVASAPLYFAVVAMPGSAASAAISALPFASALLLRASERPAPRERAASGGARGGAPEPVGAAGARSRIGRAANALVPIGACFFLAFCGQLFRDIITVTSGGEGFALMGDLYVLGGAAGAGALLAAEALRGRRLEQSPGGGGGLPASPGGASARVSDAAFELRAIRALLAVAVLGFLSSVVPGVPIHVGFALFSAAFWCARVLSWGYSARAAEEGGVPALRAYGVSLSAFSLPVALSASFVGALTAGVSEGRLPWASVAVLAVALLFFIALSMQDPRDLDTCWGLAPGRAADEDAPARRAPHGDDGRIAELAREYSLTDRESEVALLLYRGRSVPYIQQELGIAQGTAYTHARHIYQKLGVHTRQEFITLVDNIEKPG